MKKLLTMLLLVVFIAGSSFAQLVNESFDGATFPPTGWIKTSNTMIWQRSTNTVHPSAGGTHSGAGLAYANSWTASSGTTAALITPAVNFTAAPAYTASFWMYRDGGYLTNADKIDVQVNTTASTTGAVTIGTVNRSINLAPVVSAAGWYKYTFNIPSTYNGATNYIIFFATSAYGNDIHIDDVVIDVLAVPGVAGIVSPPDGAIGLLPNTITLNWSAPTTGGPVTAYKLFMGTNPAADNIINGLNVGNVLTYTPIALNLNTTYYWKVVPLNPAGDAVGVPIWSFQTLLTCSFAGLVSDGITGDPIPGVNVSVASESTTTGDDGTYYLEIDPGTYTVVFTKVGYQTVTVSDTSAVYGPSSIIDAQMYEEAIAPAVLTAVVNATDTQCDLTWTPPFGPYEMMYDDGTAENFAAWQLAGNMNAVKFTPAGYPAEVQGGRVFVGDGSFPVGGNLLGQTFKMIVMDDNGAAGMPGTGIDSVEVTANNYGWVDFSGLHANIASGNFYLTMVQGSGSPNCVPVGVDQTQPTSYKSYSRNVVAGGAWALSPYQDLMIRAYIAGPVGGGDNSISSAILIPSKFQGIISLSDPLASAGFEGSASIIAHPEGVGDAVANYKLFRMPLPDPNLPIPVPTPSQLIASPAATSYSDAGGSNGWLNLAPGWYAYAVQAKYPNGDLSDYTYSQKVGHKMQASVTVNVALTTGGSPAGATVTLEANSYPYLSPAPLVVPASGQVIFPVVWQGNYTITAHFGGFTDGVIVDNVDENKVYNIMLEELKFKPRNLYVDDMTLIATWDAPQSVLVDENFEGVTFPPVGWQKFSSGAGWFASNNGGSSDYTIPAHTRYAVTNDDGAGSSNNGCCDYLVMPPVDLTGAPDYTLSFQSCFPSGYTDIATVEMSTDGGANWQEVFSLSPLIGAWAQVDVDLTAYSGSTGESNVLIAFHYNDNTRWARGWAVDDVKLVSGSVPVQGYGIFLDGTEVFHPIMETTWTFDPTTINYGQTYVAGVAGIYSNGYSDQDYYTFTSHFLYPPRNLTATPFESAAILAWEAPVVGDAPQGGMSYQEYLRLNNLQETPAPNAEQGLAPGVNSSLPGVTLPVDFGRSLDSKAWGDDAIAGDIVTFRLDNPAALTVIGSEPGDFIAGADIVDGVYYGCVYGGTFISMDTASGSITTIGSTTDMSGLAYDFTASTMYGVSFSGTLYTVDLVTGATTSVGSTQSSLICLACDNDGILYGVDITNDNFGSINKATGAWTVIGSVGFNASYAQDMTCDHSTNTIYWAAYNAGLGSGQLYIVDQTSGALTLIGNFAGSTEITGFGIGATGGGSGGGEPAGLVSYNLFRDDVLIANIPKTELQYFDLNLFPDDYCYDITAVYDLTAYGQTGGFGQSVKEGTACVNINYGFPVPFLEDWNSGTFSLNTWTTEQNWRMAGQMGNPMPSAEFGWDPPQVDYSLGLVSSFINSAGMSSSTSIYKIYLDFDLALADRTATSNEKMNAEVWNGSTWVSVAEFVNNGDLAFTTQHIDITAKAKNRVFRVRFVASGASSTDIYYWLVDNIHIYYEFAPALNLISSQTINPLNNVHLSWEAPVGGGASGDSFTEDFELGVTPDGWQIITTDTYTGGPVPATWTVTNYTSATFVPFGTYHCGLWWDYDHQDEWLITSEFACDATTSLTFESSVFEGSTNLDHYYVKVSKDGGSTWTVVWDASTLTGNAWNYYSYPYSISLSAFAGENIKVAWNAVDGDGQGLWYVWFVDNIAVTSGDGMVRIPASSLTHKGLSDNNAQHQDAIARDGNIKAVSATHANLNMAGSLKGADNSQAITGYNVYRKGSVGDYEIIGSTPETMYDDLDLDFDCYFYYVTVVYNEGESNPSNIVDECFYVGINNNTAASVRIYPNPATTTATVDLTSDIRKMTVFNYLGAVVFEKNIATEKSVVINTSNFASGAYAIRFTTANGETFSKKLAIIK
jgi:hypothetical protein